MLCLDWHVRGWFTLLAHLRPCAQLSAASSASGVTQQVSLCAADVSTALWLPRRALEGCVAAVACMAAPSNLFKAGI